MARKAEISAEWRAALEAAGAWHVRMGDPATKDERGLEAWFSADPLHKEAYDHIARTRARLVSAREPLREALAASAQRTRRAFVVGAGATVPIALTALFWPRAITHATVVGQRREVRLSNGIEIALNTDTEIVIKAGRTRASLARGEVFVDTR
ncbi:MAG TPA: DUF4880 domain-containing protein, partial [Verrucomicrobiae bacterium]|nr:DUF4880 domain-containing protein [Verrucomicrobiae bacterium]